VLIEYWNILFCDAGFVKTIDSPVEFTASLRQNPAEAFKQF